MGTRFLHLAIGIMSMLYLTATHGQIGINEDGTAPDSSAILDVKSNSQGFLPPRMTIAQIEGISSPADGLQVYCTDLNLPLFFDGNMWLKMDGSAIHAVGEFYNGGFIFYIFPPGFTVLIGRENDQSNAPWGCYGTYIGGTSPNMGTGDSNTALIVAGCPVPAIAARVCDTLEYLGYTDWFLPSRDELLQYFSSNVTINWSSSSYYTSSEVDDNNCWTLIYPLSTPFSQSKSPSRHVRCIRQAIVQ